MALSPQEVSDRLASDVRAKRFLSRSVAVEGIVRDVIAFMHGGEDKLQLAKVISLGEQWVRLALQYDLSVGLATATSKATEQAVAKTVDKRLDDLELKVQCLGRGLYDTQQSTDVLRRLLLSDGEAARLLESGTITVGDLMVLEPAVFILAVSP